MVVIFAFKRLTWVPASSARMHLKKGASLVDVRSTGEFSNRHLPDAINIPLNEVESTTPKRLPDKNQVVLLHCLSGTRSGIARRTLKAMGYANVFNLGSYARAQRIVRGEPEAPAGGCGCGASKFLKD